MKNQRFLMLAVGAILCCGGLLQPAAASTQVSFFDVMNASPTVAPALNAGDTLFVDTTVTGQVGALSQAVTFNVGAGVTGLSGLAAWALSTAAGPGPRLVGVNFDLFDAGNVLVASDAFIGTLGGFAHSTFSNVVLSPGTYKLVATGNGVRESMFDLALNFTGTPPAAPSIEVGALPAQGPGIADPLAYFTKLQDSRTVAPALLAGDTLLVDTLVTSELGALAQSVLFTLEQGVDSLAADIAWMITAADGVGPRLVGFNVDLVDANNVVLLSDTFLGTQGGFAHSTLQGAIGPGSYKLVITGNGVRNSSYDIALSFGGTPIIAPVPEPASIALVLAGLACVVVSTPRRRRVTG